MQKALTVYRSTFHEHHSTLQSKKASLHSSEGVFSPAGEEIAIEESSKQGTGSGFTTPFETSIRVKVETKNSPVKLAKYSSQQTIKKGRNLKQHLLQPLRQSHSKQEHYMGSQVPNYQHSIPSG